MKEFLDFIKSIATTAIAVAVVLAGSYNFAEEQLNEKIRLVSSAVVQETFELIHLEDAIFQLEKENDKFVHGDFEMIRKQNLELILKYQDQIWEKYPSKRMKLKWATEYYDSKFVVSRMASNSTLTAKVEKKPEKKRRQDETAEEYPTRLAMS